jgi:hypothetical protein
MSTQLTPDERELAAQTGFSHEVLSLLKNTVQSELRHWSIKAFRAADEALPPFSIEVRLGEPEQIEGADYPVRFMEADGVYALLSEASARDLVLALREPLSQHGYSVAVIGSGDDVRTVTRESLDEANAIYQGQCAIGVLKGTDVCDFLRLQNTNGANFDLDTEDIVARLAQWEKRCSLFIVGAGFDWLDLQFDTLPDDLQAFAEEVYEFCPDTLDQGYVGPPLGNGREISDMSQEEMLEMVEELGAAIDSQTPADLAEYLQREKRLWLWWD